MDKWVCVIVNFKTNTTETAEKLQHKSNHTNVIRTIYTQTSRISQPLMSHSNT